MNQKTNEAAGKLPQNGIPCVILTENGPTGGQTSMLEIDGVLSARSVIRQAIEVAKQRQAFVDFSTEGVKHQVCWTSNFNNVLALHERCRDHRKLEKSHGQLAYERDLAARPNYDDGARRRGWDRLDDVCKDSWERNPTDRNLPETQVVRFEIGQRVFVSDAAPFTDGWYVLHRAETVSGRIETPDTVVTLCLPDNAPGDYMRVLASQLRESAPVVAAGKVPVAGVSN